MTIKQMAPDLLVPRRSRRHPSRPYINAVIGGLTLTSTLQLQDVELLSSPYCELNHHNPTIGPAHPPSVRLLLEETYPALVSAKHAKHVPE